MSGAQRDAGAAARRAGAAAGADGAVLGARDPTCAADGAGRGVVGPAPGPAAGAAPAPAPMVGDGVVQEPDSAPASDPAAAAAPASVLRPDPAPDPALDIRCLSFAYPGGGPVLRGVSLALHQGAFALVVGATGSGKSTLLSLVKPEVEPAGERGGEIRVFGRPLEELDGRESAAQIGLVFQSPENQIVCESVWHEMAFCLENLGTPQEEMRRLVAETSYFFGMEDWFRQDTATLSGGRKQLLALASTLVAQPRLLLLDEPTAQLDPIAEKNFLHALFRVNRELGCTVVVATHSPSAMVDYATCAFELVDGSLREVRDLEALRARPQLLPNAGSYGGEGDPSAAPAAAVELERAFFRYEREGAWVLRGLDLCVRRGRIHAIVGGNGCGKSTLLAIAAGINKLQRGRLRVAPGARALMPQDPKALFAEETALDELLEWRRIGGFGPDEARAMLARLGLAGCGARHPYDLSGGQQQLLALGKVLLVNPQLLLLDEPTKGLDADARALIARLLAALRAQGKTVLVATHDLDFVRQLADDVSMMFDGEIACTQPAEEFFERNVYYRP